MQNHCVISVFHCVEGTFWCGIRGHPKNENESPQDELSGPVLCDTARLPQRYPPIARYGVFGVSTWPIGCNTPSPFSERFPLGEHVKWGCDTSTTKGYLSDTCAIPHENKAKWARYAPLRTYYLEKVLRDTGRYLALGRQAR